MGSEQTNSSLLAAFIITYERAEIIEGTIHKILNQTLPPSKLLIIDNSESESTKQKFNSLYFSNVHYVRMAQNIGPAGAAFFGLKFLADEGFQWIYWGDDNDPPTQLDTFERLISCSRTLTMVGAVGSFGGYLNRGTGQTMNLKNSQLNDIVSVDYITGNRDFIINGDVVRSGILPSAELFFGFEELDYCLKIKAAGYSLLIDGRYWRNLRFSLGLIHPEYSYKGKDWGKTVPGLRQYYSSRNILIILQRNRLYFAWCYNIIKIFSKLLLGYQFGLTYGNSSIRIYGAAVFDYFSGRYGQKKFK